MKEKILLVQSKYGYTHARIDKYEHSEFTDNGYTILTESVEVDFPELPKEVIVNNQIAVIDKQITKVMAESEAQITQLKARKQELLAITHDKGE